MNIENLAFGADEPRICELLGVHVGELFSLKEGCDPETLFYISPDGTFATFPPRAHNASFGIMLAIQDKELVIHFHERLSLPEKGMLKMLGAGSVFGIELRKSKNGGLEWRGRGESETSWRGLFSWLPEGKTICANCCSGNFNYLGVADLT